MKRYVHGILIFGVSTLLELIIAQGILLGYIPLGKAEVHYMLACAMANTVITMLLGVALFKNSRAAFFNFAADVSEIIDNQAKNTSTQPPNQT